MAQGRRHPGGPHVRLGAHHFRRGAAGPRRRQHLRAGTGGAGARGVPAHRAGRLSVMPSSLRVRSRLHADDLERLKGKVLGDDSYDVLLTGPVRVYRPDGALLCVYLPGAMAGHVSEEQYAVLHSLRSDKTNNRGLASGSRAVQVGTQKRSYSMHVSSSILGAFDPGGTYKYCRLTAWTGKNLPQWETLHPVLRRVADQMRDHVPDRYAAQMEEIGKTHADWTVPGT